MSKFDETLHKMYDMLAEKGHLNTDAISFEKFETDFQAVGYTETDDDFGHHEYHESFSVNDDGTMTMNVSEIETAYDYDEGFSKTLSAEEGIEKLRKDLDKLGENAEIYLENADERIQMNTTEKENSMDRNEVIEQCENALLEAGTDGATIESLIETSLQISEGKPEEQVIEQLLKDTVEQLNLYSPEVEDISFSYEIADGKATLILETDDIDPIPYRNFAIFDIKEQIEEQKENDDVEYDF